MIHQTFYNLPAEKRERIEAAAIAEFSAHPYPETNINRIIPAAGIAKGSFYQYFDGKDDLYKHCAVLIYEKIFEQRLREDGGFLKSGMARVSALGLEKAISMDQRRLEALVGEDRVAFLHSMKDAPEELRILVNLHVAEVLVYPAMAKELKKDPRLPKGKDSDYLAFLLSIAELVAMEYGSLKNKAFKELSPHVYWYTNALYKAFLG